MSAIRFFHSQIPNTKYELADAKKFNKEVANLGRTRDGRADRSWTEREVQQMKDIANGLNRSEIARVIEVCRTTGMRLDEASTIRTHHIEHALRTGKLEITNTKGGRPRAIPVSERARECLVEAMKDRNRGDYVFCPMEYVKEHKIHTFEKSVEDFIYNHRDKVQDLDRCDTAHNIDRGERAALTMHGLRHTWCREMVYQLQEKGHTREEAKDIMTEYMGHGRPDVIEIYIAEAYEN